MDDLLGNNEPVAQQEDQEHDSDPYAAISQEDGTTDAVKQWQEDFQKKIAERDADAEAGYKQMKEDGANELQQLMDKHAQSVQENLENCQSAEEAFLKAKKDTTPENAWQRVAALVDFSSKASKSTKDVSRMRTVLLQLKQHGLGPATKQEE